MRNSMCYSALFLDLRILHFSARALFHTLRFSGQVKTQIIIEVTFVVKRYDTIEFLCKVIHCSSFPTQGCND